VRLLVLTGPGGVGKTRLAIEAATALLDELPDGVWLVPLAAVSDPESVPAAIADVLGVKELGDRPSLDDAGEWLRPRRLLLVLDNLEQVVRAGPALARLLAGAGGLKLLATSREVLRLRGEHDLPLPPLDLPDPTTCRRSAELATYPSVALFTSRARALAPDFELDAGNARAVAELCRRLDGLPLAIELAAARVRILPPQAMLRRLDDRFRLLAGGPADLPDRHRTLRATLDWGYDLLERAERRLFRRLGVFRGAFGGAGGRGRLLRARRGVDEVEALDLLASLLDKSLLAARASNGDGEPRFACWRRCAPTPPASSRRRARELRRRHATFFRDLAERGVPELTPATQAVPLAELAAAADDLRAALQWALEQDDPEPALRLTGSLWWFWYLHGEYREGRRWVDAALARAATCETPARARTLLGRGKLRFLSATTRRPSGCSTSATTWRAASASRACSPPRCRCRAASPASRATTTARWTCTRELALWRELGDEGGVARSLQLPRLLVVAARRPRGAAGHGADTFERFQALQDREGMAWSLLNEAAAPTTAATSPLARVKGARRSASPATPRTRKARRGASTCSAWWRCASTASTPRRRCSSAASSCTATSATAGGWRAWSRRWRAVARSRGDAARAVRLDAGAAALRETLGHSRCRPSRSATGPPSAPPPPPCSGRGLRPLRARRRRAAARQARRPRPRRRGRVRPRSSRVETAAPSPLRLGRVQACSPGCCGGAALAARHAAAALRRVGSAAGARRRRRGLHGGVVAHRGAADLLDGVPAAARLSAAAAVRRRARANARGAALPYVDPYIFLFAGGMAIAAAMQQHDLHRRSRCRSWCAVGAAPRRAARRRVDRHRVRLAVALQHRHGDDDVPHRPGAHRAARGAARAAALALRHGGDARRRLRQQHRRHRHQDRHRRPTRSSPASPRSWASTSRSCSSPPSACRSSSCSCRWRGGRCGGSGGARGWPATSAPKCCGASSTRSGRCGAASTR
jgi:predicted ATPase